MARCCLFGLLLLTLQADGQHLSRMFFPSQTEIDLKVLRDALTTLHPGLYRYNTREEIASNFESLGNATARQVNEKVFFLHLSKFVASLGCGQTCVNPAHLSEEVSSYYLPRMVLPLCFVIIDGKMIVTHNLSADTSIHAGDEITKINDIYLARILDSLLQVSRSDGRHSRSRLASLEVLPRDVRRSTLFDIYFPLFFKKAPLQLEVKPPGGRAVTKTLTLVTTAERGAAYDARYGPYATFDARPLGGSNAFYLKIGSFRAGDLAPGWLDSVFASLGNSAGNLIVDLRENEGGSDVPRDLLLSYLLPGDFDFREFGEHRYSSFLSVPQPLRQFLTAPDTTVYAARPDRPKNALGLYEEPLQPSTIRVRNDRFRGKIFLLTSAQNGSAAFEFAWIFQRERAGTIVGDTTGGTKQGLNGEKFVFLTLPYSGIEVDIPLVSRAHPGEKDEGVVPDRAILTTQEEIVRGNDPQLERVLEMIQKNSN